MAFLFYFISTYVVLLSVCAIRFSTQNKTVNDPYDTLDYVAMVLLSPIFVIHKMYTWMTNNWEWLLFTYIPNVFIRICSGVRILCSWLHINVIIRIYNFVAEIVKLCKKIYQQLHRFLLSIYDFIVKLKDLLYMNLVEPVVCFIKDVVVKTVNYIYNSVLYPLFEFFLQLYNNIVTQLRVFFNFCARQLIVFFNYVCNQLTIFFNFLIRKFNEFVEYFAKVVPKLIAKLCEYIETFVEYFAKVLRKLIAKLCEYIETFVKYLKYVWNGIYDNILHPMYMYLIYYPFYTFLWQNLIQTQLLKVWTFCEFTYNYLEEMFYNAVVDFQEKCVNLYNKFWSTIEDLYARLFNGQFVRMYNTFAEKMNEMYNTFAEKMTLMYDRLSYLYTNWGHAHNKQD